MVEKLEEVTNQVEAQEGKVEVERDRYEETIKFLRWLGDHNFTFMGYKEYDLVNVDGDTELRPTADKGLGLFGNRNRVRSVKLSDFPDSARLEAKKPFLLIMTKGNTPSRIHRPAYTDYIGIKKFDKDGKVVGEHRFTGLYTSAVYNQSVESIPLIREKLNVFLPQVAIVKVRTLIKHCIIFLKTTLAMNCFKRKKKNFLKWVWVWCRCKTAICFACLFVKTRLVVSSAVWCT